MRQWNELKSNTQCKTSNDINKQINRQDKDTKHEQDHPKSTRTATKRSTLTNETLTVVDNPNTDKKRKVGAPEIHKTKVGKKKKYETILLYVYTAVNIMERNVKQRRTYVETQNEK